MSEFTHYLQDLFSPLGDIEAKRMFGGYGIFMNDLMFGLVADEELYLKVDDQNRADFEALGLPAFMYPKKDKMVALSFCLAPADALENRDIAQQWGQKAYEAAKRAARAKRPKRSK